MDVVTDQLESKKYYKADEDPKLVTLKKLGMGPMKDGWKKTTKPLMCCYKLVRIKCKVLGLQSKLEHFIMSFERDIFLKFHKQILCWSDAWYGMSLEQIIQEEQKLFDDMNKKVATVKEQEKQLLEKEKKEGKKDAIVLKDSPVTDKKQNGDDDEDDEEEEEEEEDEEKEENIQSPSSPRSPRSPSQEKGEK